MEREILPQRGQNLLINGPHTEHRKVTNDNLQPVNCQKPMTGKEKEWPNLPIRFQSTPATNQRATTTNKLLGSPRETDLGRVLPMHVFSYGLNPIIEYPHWKYIMCFQVFKSKF